MGNLSAWREPQPPRRVTNAAETRLGTTFTGSSHPRMAGHRPASAAMGLCAGGLLHSKRGAYAPLGYCAYRDGPYLLSVPIGLEANHGTVPGSRTHVHLPEAVTVLHPM